MSVNKGILFTINYYFTFPLSSMPGEILLYSILFTIKLLSFLQYDSIRKQIISNICPYLSQNTLNIFEEDISNMRKSQVYFLLKASFTHWISNSIVRVGVLWCLCLILWKLHTWALVYLVACKNIIIYKDFFKLKNVYCHLNRPHQYIQMNHSVDHKGAAVCNQNYLLYFQLPKKIYYIFSTKFHEVSGKGHWNRENHTLVGIWALCLTYLSG
jgi:hypothetical protein